MNIQFALNGIQSLSFLRSRCSPGESGVSKKSSGDNRWAALGGQAGPSGPSNSGEQGVSKKSSGDNRWAASDGRGSGPRLKSRGLLILSNEYSVIRCSPGE